jgi:uncharacterized RDD family membrane protein YckC
MSPRTRLLRMIKTLSPFLPVTSPVLLLGILLLAILASTAGAEPRELMATASDEAVVVARVQPPDKTDPDAPTDQSLILTRELGKETHWRKLAMLSGRVVSVAACDTDAKVLLDTGEWMTLWSDGSALGPPVADVRLVALAADHDLLWAVGMPAPLRTGSSGLAATSPTTEPALAGPHLAADGESAPPPATGSSSQPSTQSSFWPRTPALYRFDGSRWSRVMPLPPGVQVTDPAQFSLAVINHQPVLATSIDGRGIYIWTGQDDHWSRPREVRLHRPVSYFDILNAGLPATLWFTQGGPGTLVDPSGEKPLGPDASPASDPRSAARAAEAIRLYSATGDHLYEQTYGADGTPMGTRAELMVDLVGPDSEIQNWLAPTLTVILTMLLFGAARRGGLGEIPPGLLENKLTLAPLFPRFAAGTIDALPVLISILLVARQMELTPTPQEIPTSDQMIPFYIGSGIYLLYMICAELLFGKTLGKWIFGLRIVTLAGTPAPRAALLLRNVLRLVDLILMWLPLAMILFSPLRQRVGDLAAGTLVARAGEPPVSET